jgi:4-aminobutyrate aminotransferase-like enzyme
MMVFSLDVPPTFSSLSSLDLLAQNLTISVGHNHPAVMKAHHEQLEKMVHCTTMYYHEENSLAGEEFVKRLPPPPPGSGPGEDWYAKRMN